MVKAFRALARFRAICLSLPDTKETLTWGKPHFRVGEKIFAGFGDEGGADLVTAKRTPTRKVKAERRRS
ncbi:MAG: hypothetical protein ACKVXR_02230 [Planctomycetota bacterium]